MNDKLDKLIEQYERETRYKARHSVSHVLHWSNKFLLWMTQHAYRPTCGEEQRKFLDEIEKINLSHNLIEVSSRDQHDKYNMQEYCGSKNIDLFKVIEGE